MRYSFAIMTFNPKGETMTIDTKKTALLVIDAIEAVADDSLYDPDAATKAYRENVARAVAAAHAAGMPVIYCNDAHVPGLDRELELWGEHGVAGGTRVFPEIEQAVSDITIPKRRYSGFFQTDLDLTLRELSVTTVVAVGADTNICVLHTLADAYFNGYASVVVTDATMTFLCGTQAGALEHCEKCYGSALVTVAELEAALA